MSELSEIELEVIRERHRTRTAAAVAEHLAARAEAESSAKAAAEARLWTELDAQCKAARDRANPLEWMTYRPKTAPVEKPAPRARLASVQPKTMQLDAAQLDDLRWRAQAIIAERRSLSGLAAGAVDLSDADVPTIQRELIRHSCTL